MILPVENFKGNSAGEDMFWQKCSEYLPEEYVSFHDIYIAGIHQFDVIVLVPDHGVLIIEIKSYKAKNIMHIPDRNIIMMKNNIPEGSPFKHVMNNRDTLIKYLSKNDDELRRILVTGVVGYPNITEAAFFDKQLDKISPRRLAFLQDDLESKDRFISKINDIFCYSHEEISNPNLEKYLFDQKSFVRAGNLISSEFREISVEEKVIEVKQEQERAQSEARAGTEEIIGDIIAFVEYLKSEAFIKDIDENARKYEVPPKDLQENFLMRSFEEFSNMPGIASETIEVKEAISKISSVEKKEAIIKIISFINQINSDECKKYFCDTAQKFGKSPNDVKKKYFEITIKNIIDILGIDSGTKNTSEQSKPLHPNNNQRTENPKVKERGKITKAIVRKISYVVYDFYHKK